MRDCLFDIRVFLFGWGLSCLLFIPISILFFANIGILPFVLCLTIPFLVGAAIVIFSINILIHSLPEKEKQLVLRILK